MSSPSVCRYRTFTKAGPSCCSATSASARLPTELQNSSSVSSFETSPSAGNVSSSSGVPAKPGTMRYSTAVKQPRRPLLNGGKNSWTKRGCQTRNSALDAGLENQALQNKESTVRYRILTNSPRQLPKIRDFLKLRDSPLLLIFRSQWVSEWPHCCLNRNPLSQAKFGMRGESNYESVYRFSRCY